MKGEAAKKMDQNTFVVDFMAMATSSYQLVDWMEDIGERIRRSLEFTGPVEYGNETLFLDDGGNARVKSEFGDEGLYFFTPVQLARFAAKVARKMMELAMRDDSGIDRPAAVGRIATGMDCRVPGGYCASVDNDGKAVYCHFGWRPIDDDPYNVCVLQDIVRGFDDMVLAMSEKNLHRRFNVGSKKGDSNE